MSGLANLTLGAEIRAFGDRVFELTEDGDDGRPARRAAAEAARAYVRARAAQESRRARRALETAFKGLTDAVRALDGLARDSGARAVLASALAAEGSGLREEVYDLITGESAATRGRESARG